MIIGNYEPHPTARSVSCPKGRRQAGAVGTERSEPRKGSDGEAGTPKIIVPLRYIKPKVSHQKMERLLFLRLFFTRNNSVIAQNTWQRHANHRACTFSNFGYQDDTKSTVVAELWLK